MTQSQKEFYICVDIDANKNKFWTIQKTNNGITTTWGKIRGTDPSTMKIQGTKDWPGDTEKLYNKKVNEKTRDGRGSGTYSLVNLASTTNIKSSVSSIVEWECEETRKLVDYLTKVNIHNITNNSQIIYKDGVLQTVFGLLSPDTVTNARKVLTDIHKEWKKGVTRNDLLNQYFRLIPRDVGTKFDVYLKDRFLKDDGFSGETDLLDSLEVSLQTTDKTDIKIDSQRTKLVQNTNELAWATKRFQDTAKDMHVSKQWKPQKMWDISRKENVNESIGNKQMYWHGTKASNLLSILHNGLIIPPANASYCCGRLYGNGIYFSDCSTKSLNYACGYWDGKYSDTCYMLLCDVFMGKTFNVNHSYGNLPKPGYDSTSAIPGQAGIQNTEFIVYNVNQVRLKHLLEFKR